MSDLVSVIMPCYNYGAFIHGAINSVLSQTHQNWELLIINDGSTDDTIERVEQFDDPRIRLITIDNSGVSVARNIGLDAARGEFIAFLDADDLWDARKTELQLNVFSRHPEVGFVFSDLSRFDDVGSSYGNFLSFCPQLQTLVQKNGEMEEIVFPGNAFVELSGLSEMPWYPTANMVRSFLCKDIRLSSIHT
jgi:glycosyltransferase involved in cell wall biosynthesis